MWFLSYFCVAVFDVVLGVRLKTFLMNNVGANWVCVFDCAPSSPCPLSSPCIRLQKETETYLSSAISTLGYQNISIIYSLSTSGLTTTDFCSLYYSTDGANPETWTEIAKYADTDFIVTDQLFALNTVSADNNDIGINFKFTLYGTGNDDCYIYFLAVDGISFPTAHPSIYPSSDPTTFTIGPTAIPTAIPTSIPTILPTLIPTSIPTRMPSAMPTANHSSVGPSHVPTGVPTGVPTLFPIESPTYAPTRTPTAKPSTPATNEPSSSTSTSTSTTVRPIVLSSAHPSSYPSAYPTAGAGAGAGAGDGDGGGGSGSGVAVVVNGGVASADAVVTQYLSVGIIAGCACTAIAAVSLIAVVVYRRKQTAKLERLKAEADFDSLYDSGIGQTAPTTPTTPTTPAEGAGHVTSITDVDLAIVTEDAEFMAVADAAAARNLAAMGNRNAIFESAIESEYDTAYDQTYASVYETAR